MRWSVLKGIQRHYLASFFAARLVIIIPLLYKIDPSFFKQFELASFIDGITEVCDRKGKCPDCCIDD